MGPDRDEVGDRFVTAISLTFDDAIDQHLDIVIPLLDQHELCGTFYAHLSAPSLAGRRDSWQRAAQQGHEIGNHTIFHPADAAKNSVRQGNALNLYTPDRMLLEVEIANQWLDAFNGPQERSFAYPCSNLILGNYGIVNRLLFSLGLRNTRLPAWVESRGLDIYSTRYNYAALLHGLVVAARGTGLYMSDTAPELGNFDRFNLPSPAVDGHSFEQIKGYIERSLKCGSWAILQFHGVGGGHRMDCNANDFHQLITWIAKNHADLVCTVADGAQRLLLNSEKQCVEPRHA